LSFAGAVAPLLPTLREAPAGLPSRFDEPTISAGSHYTLDTSVGPIDLRGEVAGGGRCEDLPRRDRIAAIGRGTRPFPPAQDAHD